MLKPEDKAEGEKLTEEISEKREAEEKTEELAEPQKQEILEEKVEKEAVKEAKEAKVAKEEKAAKPKKKRKAEEEEEKANIVEEKVYTIPLGRVWNIQQPYRTPKSIKLVRNYIKRHMKADVVKLQAGLNRFMWRRGIEKPPRRVRVRATKDKDGNVKVYLAEGEK